MGELEFQKLRFGKVTFEQVSSPELGEREARGHTHHLRADQGPQDL